MCGRILLAPEDVKSERELDGWVSRGLQFARSLPPKG
jgi:hypothetical protein